MLKNVLMSVPGLNERESLEQMTEKKVLIKVLSLKVWRIIKMQIIKNKIVKNRKRGK